MVDCFAHGWRDAELDGATIALLEYTEKLTSSPAAVDSADVERLREAGWNDRAVTDAAQVCAYFNYINRIAEGIGAHPEDWIDEVGATAKNDHRLTAVCGIHPIFPQAL